MKFKLLIIDGYNLLHCFEELVHLLRKDIALARHRLVRKIEETTRNLAEHTIIVFDGREAGQDPALSSAHVEVRFSPGNISADGVIERLVCQSDEPDKILVVTSDHIECDNVLSGGAQTMSSDEFKARYEADARRTYARRTPPGEQPKLGDIFPDFE